MFDRENLVSALGTVNANLVRPGQDAHIWIVLKMIVEEMLKAAPQKEKTRPAGES